MSGVYSDNCRVSSVATKIPWIDYNFGVYCLSSASIAELVMASALWIVIQFHVISTAATVDFRLHPSLKSLISYFRIRKVFLNFWCSFLLLPVAGLLVIRIRIKLPSLYFTATRRTRSNVLLFLLLQICVWILSRNSSKSGRCMTSWILTRRPFSAIFLVSHPMSAFIDVVLTLLLCIEFKAFCTCFTARSQSLESRPVIIVARACTVVLL